MSATAGVVSPPASERASPVAWFVYLIECTDGSIYTGIAVDVDARYAAHVLGKGARYTRAHPPARLLARFAHADRSAASKAEYAIKQLSPAAKRALCAGSTSPPAPHAQGYDAD
ncbi:MAG: GIY-YIG nuclease family protein [Metallibacterium scheffleri]